MKTLERLIYYIERNNGEKAIRETKLLSMLKDVQREHEEELQQVKSVDLADVVGRSEQLKCQCKKAKFTRTVDADFNPLCARCGKAL